MSISPKPKDARAILNAQGRAALRDAVADVEPIEPEAAPHEPEATPQEPDTGRLGIPEKYFPVPAGGISITAAAKTMFATLGEQRKIFIRGTSVHEVVKSDDVHYLSPITAERFCSVVESTGKFVAKREERNDPDGKKSFAWRRCTLPASHAKTILASDPAQRLLPAIRQVVNCPILTPDGRILEQGYHDHEGGTYITSGQKCEAVELSIAIPALKHLLMDFDFPSTSDYSRAFASLISPALKMGGWINDDFPLDLAEADQSQSGKTYRQKLVCRIYGEKPSSITISKGGVGSTDEKISEALIRGKPFITLGNVRGKIDSQILEEALRGTGRVTCRTLRNSAEVDCRPFLWQLSTNGAELTRDLANRAIVCRIRKRPDAYKWRIHPEGDLESHIIRNQGFYLSCVFAVIKDWHRLGCPITDENRHDFRGWCRALDGIVQMVGCSPLLDGHREQQQRTANPGLQWLREIILSARPEDFGRELYTTNLVDIAEDHDIAFPGNPYSKDDPSIRAGKILGKIFKDAGSDEIAVDGFTFTRMESEDYTAAGGSRVVKKYTISKPL
jgi:hypothetical protein